ncbi:hypothetical protein [Butyrivibrio sp. INlla21]|uniref:hypothetical protein n=1 Tax=Butyrivibrio sp. INlla21 TaxID=1520811 RepID=UPI0008E03644|nr:hypothetical protein [Butyrivibrio sp. INlla21]SFU36718.1 hypothetical protein SAMN02910342_00270 [Butyrivibrio sp. INlla21]
MDDKELLEFLANQEGDRVFPPYVVRKKEYAMYEQAIATLDKLVEQGKLTYTATPLNENFVIHAIEIEWIPDEYDYVSLGERETMEAVASLFSGFSEFLFERDTPMKWLFTTNIYCSKI